jgi:hypothetical protein
MKQIDRNMYLCNEMKCELCTFVVFITFIKPAVYEDTLLCCISLSIPKNILSGGMISACYVR